MSYDLTSKRVIVYVWDLPDNPQKGLMDELVRSAKDVLHMTIVKQYIDKCPNQFAERPSFHKLIGMMHNHRTDYVMVFDILQIARTMKTLADFTNLLKTTNVDLLCVKGVIDTATPERKALFFSIVEQLTPLSAKDRKLFFSTVKELSLLEKKNHEKIDIDRSDRIRDGMERAKSEGKLLGRPSLSEEKLKRLFEMQLQGIPQKQIVEELKISRNTYKKYAIRDDELLPENLPD